MQRKKASGHFFLLFLLLAHTDLATHSHREGGGVRGGAGFCRAILLVILSQRQGRAGATAVCLIACAMGVGSIIRPLCHPAAIPASSAPADSIPYSSRKKKTKKKPTIKQHSNSDQRRLKHPRAVAAKLR